MVTFSLFEHRGEQKVKIGFAYDPELKDYVAQFPNSRWSRTYGCFYIPYSKSAVNDLFQYLRAKNLFVDYSLLKRANHRNKVPTVKKFNTVELSGVKKEAIDGFVEWMRQKRYSENTIKT